MNGRHFRSALALFGIVYAVCAFPAGRALGAENTSIIDTPTTGLLDYGAYNLSFRLFSEGGVLTRLDFGVFKIVNLGFGWEVRRIIGSQDARVGPPALSLKIRPYAGGLALPAFAFGYDGQGYYFDNELNAFTQKEKGIYAVAGREILFPGLHLSLGANINDFKTGKVYGFAGLLLNVEDTFLILAEWDNVNTLPESRLNLGFRYFVTEALSMDLTGRDIGADGRRTERMIRVNYRGRF